MRISDWSSDVCSSDLGHKIYPGGLSHHPQAGGRLRQRARARRSEWQRDRERETGEDRCGAQADDRYRNDVAEATRKRQTRILQARKLEADAQRPRPVMSTLQGPLQIYHTDTSARTEPSKHTKRAV